MNTTKITLADIAKMAGVSQSTASLVLNNKAKGGNVRISDKTVQRVQDVATEAGYFVGLSARAKSGGRTSIVGLIIYTMNYTNPQLFMMEGISGIFKKNKVSLATGLVTQGDLALELDEIRMMTQKGFDGVILEASTELLNLLQENPSVLPRPDRIVLMNRPPVAGLPTVRIDEMYCGYLAAKHLLELGHRHVAFLGDGHSRSVAPADAFRSQVCRYQGYLKALQEYQADPIHMVDLEHFFQHPKVTGVYCGLSRLAPALLAECWDRNIRVPQDVSIVAHGDVHINSPLRPRLTTLDTLGQEMGQLAAEQILKRIEGQEIDSIVLQPKLIARDSTAPPKRA